MADYTTKAKAGWVVRVPGYYSQTITGAVVEPWYSDSGKDVIGVRARVGGKKGVVHEIPYGRVTMMTDDGSGSTITFVQWCETGEITLAKPPEFTKHGYYKVTRAVDKKVFLIAGHAARFYPPVKGSSKKKV